MGRQHKHIALFSNVKVLTAAWEAVSDEVRHVFIEAESKHIALNSIDLGSVARTPSRRRPCGRPSVACRSPPRVVTVVSREAPAAWFGKKSSVGRVRA